MSIARLASVRRTGLLAEGCGPLPIIDSRLPMENCRLPIERKAPDPQSGLRWLARIIALALCSPGSSAQEDTGLSRHPTIGNRPSTTARLGLAHQSGPHNSRARVIRPPSNFAKTNQRSPLESTKASENRTRPNPGLRRSGFRPRIGQVLYNQQTAAEQVGRDENPRSRGEPGAPTLWFSAKNRPSPLQSASGRGMSGKGRKAPEPRRTREGSNWSWRVALR